MVMNKEQRKNYYGCIDLAVQNNSHTQVFNFLCEHCLAHDVVSPRVLEIGCSNGYFSHALRDNGFYVYGVEPFGTDAEECGRVNDFFHGTVEDFCKAKADKLRRGFDAIILGDVIEHLVDPEKTLWELAGFLNPEGVFIASVPNITHIGIRSMLGDGQWAYQKYGLLDSTHLRFFSWNSLRELFIGLGFGIEKRYNVLVPEHQVYPSAQAITNYLASNGALDEKEHTFQFVIRASRKALAKDAYVDASPRNILLISPGPASSLTALRLIKPLSRYLAESGGAIRTMLDGQCDADSLRWADVLIAHREISVHTLEVFRYARALGLPIIYDMDDLLMSLPAWSSHAISPLGKEMMRGALASAKRVTCTTQRLKDELEKEAGNVTLVPNVILDASKSAPLSMRHCSDECSLIIASSDSVLVDFLIDPVKLVTRAIPSLKLVVIGPIDHAFKDISAQISFHGQCSPEEFSAILDSIENGIGLIPLDDSLFSSCKSPIKYYHYTSCGIVTIASAVEPYTGCIEHGKNGLLAANETDSWREAIVRLVNDYKLRQLLLARAFKNWQFNASEKTALAAWKGCFQGLPKPLAKCGG